jgi:predicted phosphoribosyltransferase
VQRAPLLDRYAAGQTLGAELARRGFADPVVLGLARGGVEVAAPVAAALSAPLDVLVVRKVGHPLQPEFGLGALAEDGPVFWDEGTLASSGYTADDLAADVERERTECRRRVAAYRSGRDRVPVAGRTAVVVDDGVATGVSALAALRAVRAAAPARVVLAAPVVAAATVPMLEDEADDVVALLTPDRFGAVSRWYGDFPQTADETVVELLSGRRPTP